MTETPQEPTADVIDEPAPAADGSCEEKEPARWRHIVSWALLILGILLLLVGSFNVWIKKQALDTNQWVTASSEFLENEEIRNTLAVYMVDQLYENVDVAGEVAATVDGPIAEALPVDINQIAAIAAGAFRELAVRAVDQILASPGVQRIWQEANRAAHEALLALLDNNQSDAISTTSDGTVVLNLQPLVVQVGDQIGLSVDGSNLPEGTGQIELFQSDELGALKGAVNAIRILSFTIAFVSVGLFVLAIWIGKGQRRRLLGTVASSLIFIGILLFVIKVVAGNALVNALIETESIQPTGFAIWEIATDLLTNVATALIAWGIIIFVGVVLAGPSGWATAFRRWLAPAFRDRTGLVWGVVALAMVLVLLWAPSGQTRELYGTLILLAVFSLGFEVFRRLTVREFPDAQPGPGMLGWPEAKAQGDSNGPTA